MKINSITPQVLNQNYKVNLNSQQQSRTEQCGVSSPLLAVRANQYMGYLPNFTGGYSLNLAQTIENLDKLAAKHFDLYPKNVREWAGMILEEGNKGKETLIGVHKRLYASIKDCFSLEELKTKFPEFKDVKSAKDVDYKEGSFLDDIQKGKVEFFNPEEDLSLQLIKLYWGEGFSLNDLRAYAGGHELNHIMNKLNIPKVNRSYGQVLKLSDPKYNERLTSQMKAKRLETLDRKAQREGGEPVYIKRGPLSAEHRQHISEGLQKYYRENPDRIFEMSERQKQFYEDNPEQKEILHRVMIRAWSIFGADHIKKALSKFMKGKGFKDFSTEELNSPERISKEKSQAMKKFWAMNEWAKKSFSKNMEHAWKSIKKEQDMYYIVDLTPNLFKKRFFAWCEKNGIDTTNLSFDEFKYYPHKPEQNKLDSSLINKYVPKFIDAQSGDESQKMANTYFLSLLRFRRTLDKLDPSKMNKDSLAAIEKAKAQIELGLYEGLTPNTYGQARFKKLGALEAQFIYNRVLNMLMNVHENKLIKNLNEELNNAYVTLDKRGSAAMAIDPITLKIHDV